MPDTSETPQKRPLKFSLPLRLAFISIASAVIVAMIAILALHIPAVQNEIISRAVNRIEDATQLKVELESYTCWPFSPLCLTNLKLFDEGRKILDCKQVKLDYSLALNRPYVKLEEVYLEKPYLQLERTAEGKWLFFVLKRLGLPGGGPAKGKTPWLNPSLPTLRIFSGTVEGRQQGRVVLSVKDITGVLPLKTVQGPGGAEIRIDLDNWEARASVLGLGT